MGNQLEFAVTMFLQLVCTKTEATYDRPTKIVIIRFESSRESEVLKIAYRRDGVRRLTESCDRKTLNKCDFDYNQNRKDLGEKCYCYMCPC